MHTHSPRYTHTQTAHTDTPIRSFTHYPDTPYLSYSIQRELHTSYLDIPTLFCPNWIGAHSLSHTHHSDTSTFTHIPNTDIATLSHTHVPSKHTHLHIYTPQLDLHSKELHPDTITFILTPNSVHPYSHIRHSDTLKPTHTPNPGIATISHTWYQDTHPQ